MRTFLMIVSILMMLATTCNDADSCITDMIDEFQMNHDDRSFVGISTFEQDGQIFHIFDSGVAFDATASVVDEACNTVCIFGGLRVDNPMPCDQFQEGINNSVQIWP